MRAVRVGVWDEMDVEMREILLAHLIRISSVQGQYGELGRGTPPEA